MWNINSQISAADSFRKKWRWATSMIGLRAMQAWRKKGNICQYFVGRCNISSLCVICFRGVSIGNLAECQDTLIEQSDWVRSRYSNTVVTVTVLFRQLREEFLSGDVLCVLLECLCVLLEYIVCKSVIYVRIVLVGFKRVVVGFKRVLVGFKRVVVGF